MSKTTLPEMWQPLMAAPSIERPYCAICGRARPLEQHHMVFRSAGELFDEHGRKMRKPTITLCGFGNNLRDADGREYCHGLAHHKRLHFRWVKTNSAKSRAKKSAGDVVMNSFVGGHLEYLLLDTPCDYLTALSMDGWKRLP